MKVTVIGVQKKLWLESWELPPRLMGMKPGKLSGKAPGFDGGKFPSAWQKCMYSENIFFFENLTTPQRGTHGDHIMKDCHCPQPLEINQGYEFENSPSQYFRHCSGTGHGRIPLVYAPWQTNREMNFSNTHPILRHCSGKSQWCITVHNQWL